MSTRWRLNRRPSDVFLRARCLLLGHRWTTNPNRTQRVCYPCWTVEDLDT